MLVDNKFAHTETPDDEAGHSFHAGHHRFFNKNYGRNCIMDMVFSTCVSNNSYKLALNKSVYNVTKTEEGDNIKFWFKKLDVNPSVQKFSKY